MITKKRQRPKEDAQENTDRWLLTYADLITLLLGLFVILYAMSKVDNGKYSKVVQALGGMFGKPAVLSGNEGILPVQRELSKTTSAAQSVESKIRAAMYTDVSANLVTVSQDERGVVVHLAEELLFPSGSAALKTSSLPSLDLLASVLKTLPNQVRVEGHTDDVPISTPVFPSNWQLSVARAMTTADYLMKKHGVNPDKVTIVGYSQYRPLVPNTSAENRAQNRRVDIVIVSTESESSHHTQESEDEMH